MPFQPKYSQDFAAELRRLDAGNASERKRAQTARGKIVAVCSAPLSPTYTKNLPENYGAVSVTGRFRLFFKVHKEHDVVFFAWMNDETNIHTSGAANDAYQEFRRRLENAEIENYIHVETVGENFVFNGTWGASYIYLEFTRSNSDGTSGEASASLTLSQVTEHEYTISSINVSEVNRGLASELTKKTIEKADESGITITYELFLRSEYLEKSRHLLAKFDFEMTLSDDDFEIWTRTPR